MKKIFSILALVMVMVFSLNLCFAQVPVMKDVDYKTDLGKSIEKLVKAGVINGIPEADGTFTYKSENSITRAEFCKMINATFGYTQTGANVFSDVNTDDWYYQDVLKACHYGYIKGYGDGRFGGKDLISREQVCVILDRIINKTSDKDVTIADKVSEWALKSVKNVIALGYMPSEENNTFRATENMTRGELALTLDDFVTVPDENTKDEENKNNVPTIKPATPGRPSSNGTSSGTSTKPEEPEESEKPEEPAPPTEEEIQTSNKIYADLELMLNDFKAKTEKNEDGESIINLEEKTVDDEVVYQLYNSDKVEIKGGPILKILIDAVAETIPLKAEGVIVSNQYIREKYESEIGSIKDMLDEMNEEDKNAFKLEVCKLNSGLLMRLMKLFNIEI